jgi:CRISPR-associated exonuclease Cas4
MMNWWLAGGALFFVLLGLILARLSLRNAQTTGLPAAHVKVVYNDTGEREEVDEPLFSKRYGLTGKPDYVLRTRAGIVPVELKPLRNADQPYESDIMQLAAYCLLLEDVWDTSPSHGLLRYRTHTFKIEWTDELRDALLDILDEMRELYKFPAHEGGDLPEPNHDMTARCRACGFHYVCYPDV